MKPDPVVPDTDAPLAAPAANKVIIELEDWGGEPARIRTSQLASTLRLYRVERLAEGTDWLATGFRYETPQVGVKGRD